MDLITIKKTFVRQRTPPTECKGNTQNTQHRKKGGKIRKSHVSDKRQISKTCRESSTRQQKSAQIQKEAKDSKRRFCKENIHTVNGCVPKRSASRIVRETQTELMEYRFVPIRTVTIRKTRKRGLQAGSTQIFARPRSPRHSSQEKSQVMGAALTLTDGSTDTRNVVYTDKGSFSS